MIADMINAWFCPGCGLRDETARGIDQDGTCSSCGADVCTWDSLRGHLSQHGWEVVSVADAELAQARALLEHWFHGRGYVGDETIDAVTQAFLARAPAQTAEPAWPTAAEVTEKALAAGNFIPQAEVRRVEIEQATALFDRLNAAMRESDEWGTGADMLRSLEEHGLRVTVAAVQPCPHADSVDRWCEANRQWQGKWDELCRELARVKEELDLARACAVSCSRQSQDDSARREAAEAELAAARPVLEALANATIERLSNGWEMLDGDSNRAVSAAEFARRQAQREGVGQ